MHKTAEYGIAAHWKYKLGSSNINIEWLKNLQFQNESIEEFYELVKNDLYSEDISVFTPAGDQISLPRGATVLDFAYAVHTQIGECASSALVNKKQASLLTELKNGNLVRIITADHQIYHCSWIDAVKTSRAKSHMRMRCNQRRKEIDRISSINILSATFYVSTKEIEEWIKEEEIESQVYRVARELNFYKEIIHRFIDSKKVRSKFLLFLQRQHRRLKQYDFENLIVYSADHIGGIEFDYCCHPKRDDPIVAFKIGNKAVVHHKFCEKAYGLIKEQTPMLYVEWSDSKMQGYRLLVTLKDEKGALAKFLLFLAKIDLNIISIKLGDRTSASNVCEVIFETKNHDQNRLKELLEKRFKLIELVSLTDAYKQI